MPRHDVTMLINNPQWLQQVLMLHGQPEGKALECFGTSYAPDDFVYFTVFPDHLCIQLHRILPGVASFYFRFLLRVEADRVAVQRILDNVEGSNKKIRRELGEQYAKTSIGVPFADLDEDEEDWVEIALAAFQKCWPA